MKEQNNTISYGMSRSISKFVFTVLAIVVFTIAVLFSFHFTSEKLNGIFAFILPGIAVSALAIIYLTIVPAKSNKELDDSESF